MPDPKNFVDKLFDTLDSAADSVGKALKQNDLPPDPDADNAEQWEAQWDEPKWCPTRVPGSPDARRWHAFRNGTTTLCGQTFTSDQLEGMRVLEHDKIVPACTSCIIGVSK